MTDSPARARQSTSDQAGRAERAGALIVRLEGQIANDAKRRAALLGSVAAPGLVEPHRDHHAYALGADQADCEFATHDALAMRGLMSLGPAVVAEHLEHVAKTAPGTHVTRLWPIIIANDRERLLTRAAAVDARRLSQLSDVSPDQQTVFETAVALAGGPGLYRDQLAYVCGADLVYCGLTAEDALAMLGLMSIGPGRLAELLRNATKDSNHIYVTRLWPHLLAAVREQYEARGRLVRWQRRWSRYNIDFEAWLASSRRHDEDWRGKPMTARQRHLVRDTAIVLDRSIPAGMDCGAAHDWLAAMGANTLFRKEM